MRRRLLALPAAAGLVVAGTALAQSDPDPYQVPEPPVRSGQVLQLPAAADCDDRLVRVRFTPPAGAVFGWFEVSVRGQERARLTGIPRAASATIRLGRWRARVRVTGETLGGQRVEAERVYPSCAVHGGPPHVRPPRPPIQQGGGED